MRDLRIRDSRIELLRVLAAIMILSRHAIQHGGKELSTFTT